MTTRWYEGTCYLQVRIHRGWQLRVVKVTQKQPTVLEEGCVVVKVRLRIPGLVFEPLQPSAVITVPEELVQRTIEVEAVDPS